MYTMKVKRSHIQLKADCKRVLLRPFSISDQDRIKRIISRINTQSEFEVERQLGQLSAEFADRHENLLQFYKKRFEAVRPFIKPGTSCSESRALLIGAYFTHEYSVESAALFNPSIVWAPDQTGLSKNRRRFILSLRATGEGHISSITFRSGTIDENQQISIDHPSRFIKSGELRTNPPAGGLGSPALFSYNLQFNSGEDVSERVIFPVSPDESNGIEDARFVQLIDRASGKYFATYTAYDGKTIRPKLLETNDFKTFTIRPLSGPAISNKGLALFPKKVNGKYAMLSRQDNENNYIIFSDDLYHWETSTIIEKPHFPWEFIQLGNCGSPIETKAGWLVLSHGVGAMRKYTIGAFLLDLDDPARLIGRTAEPILTPDATEREGYVPNVVYSCGSLLHNDQLIIPYAMSDSASTFATVNLDDLLHEIAAHKPG
jgi:predicted GH43/DUF377 family glycosyl hydrolase